MRCSGSNAAERMLPESCIHMPTETKVNRRLEQTAKLALEFGRVVMEVGGSARHVEEIAAQVAPGLGADRIDLGVGYSSLTIPDDRTRVTVLPCYGAKSRKRAEY